MHPWPMPRFSYQPTIRGYWSHLDSNHCNIARLQLIRKSRNLLISDGILKIPEQIQQELENPSLWNLTYICFKISRDGTRPLKRIQPLIYAGGRRFQGLNPDQPPKVSARSSPRYFRTQPPGFYLIDLCPGWYCSWDLNFRPSKSPALVRMQLPQTGVPFSEVLESNLPMGLVSTGMSTPPSSA